MSSHPAAPMPRMSRFFFGYDDRRPGALLRRPHLSIPTDHNRRRSAIRIDRLLHFLFASIGEPPTVPPRRPSAKDAANCLSRPLLSRLLNLPLSLPFFVHLSLIRISRKPEVLKLLVDNLLNYLVSYYLAICKCLLSGPCYSLG